MPQTNSKVALQIDGGVGRITLNRPDHHNAFDDTIIAELAGILDGVAADSDVRVVVVASNGKTFSAGADLGWMKRTAGYSVADNEADALHLPKCLPNWTHCQNQRWRWCRAVPVAAVWGWLLLAIWPLLPTMLCPACPR